MLGLAPVVRRNGEIRRRDDRDRSRQTPKSVVHRSRPAEGKGADRSRLEGGDGTGPMGTGDGSRGDRGAGCRHDLLEEERLGIRVGSGVGRIRIGHRSEGIGRCSEIISAVPESDSSDPQFIRLGRGCGGAGTGGGAVSARACRPVQRTGRLNSAVLHDHRGSAQR